ncbi:hypothetical protein [Streptomyces luteireticuli]|uniref:hypothetical protein n=1 Tax=Streptomyces luteireticuli TaxID=173858 RepID=UPI003558B58D
MTETAIFIWLSVQPMMAFMLVAACAAILRSRKLPLWPLWHARLVEVSGPLATRKATDPRFPPRQ